MWNRTSGSFTNSTAGRGNLTRRLPFSPDPERVPHPARCPCRLGFRWTSLRISLSLPVDAFGAVCSAPRRAAFGSSSKGRKQSDFTVGT